MYITPNSTQLLLQLLHLQEQEITFSEKEKLLSILVDNKLKWKTQIEKIL